MKILVGMSGGVDSAYAAKRLMDEGHSVEGLVLQMHPFTDTDMAKKCADSLGIPLHVLECSYPFERIIKANFVNEYLKARTPNPCVLCNGEIKFKFLLWYADNNGFDAIATGHYSSLVKINNETGVVSPYSLGEALSENELVTLKVSRDEKKDQTYMLYRVGSDVLKRLILPLADMTKEEVRALANELELPCAHNRDSQEICFIKDENYAEYIERVAGKSPRGNFISEHGDILGTHDGIIRYTVGQRKGLGISSDSRLFVTEIDASKNEITLSPDDKYSTKVYVSDLKLLGIPRTSETVEYRFTVKLRYTKSISGATVRIFGDNAVITLDTPQRAVTPGQSAVFYKDGILIGGGIIDKSE